MRSKDFWDSRGVNRGVQSCKVLPMIDQSCSNPWSNRLQRPHVRSGGMSGTPGCWLQPACMLCRVEWKGKKKKKKKDKETDKLDLYGLLGLNAERWTATEAEIKLGTATAGQATLKTTLIFLQPSNKTWLWSWTCTYPQATSCSQTTLA